MRLKCLKGELSVYVKRHTILAHLRGVIITQMLMQINGIRMYLG